MTVYIAFAFIANFLISHIETIYFPAMILK